MDNQQQFVCVADAVATYFNAGFKTIKKTGNEARLMEHPDGRKVVIYHYAFLDVKVFSHV
jgi:hypothetical protein